MKLPSYMKRVITILLIAAVVIGYLPAKQAKASNNILTHDMEDAKEIKLNKTKKGTSVINQNNEWCYWFELPREMKLTFSSSVTGNKPFYCVFICDDEGNALDDFSFWCTDDTWKLKKSTNTYSATRSITLEKGTYYLYLAGYGGADDKDKKYSFQLKANIPSYPKISSISKDSNGDAKISYKGISDVDGYEIFRSTSKSGKYQCIKKTTKKTYTDTDVTKGTYYYKVRAYKMIAGVKCVSYVSGPRKITI